MHSKIYEIVTEPLMPEEYRNESFFYDHWFIGSIADYVDGSIDREDCIQNLKDYLETNSIATFSKDGKSFRLLEHAKEHYFADSYKSFKNTLSKLSQCSEEEFYNCSDNIELAMQQINDLFCDKFDAYVSSDEFDTIPFDSFIRYAQIGKIYYIGGVIDYRF